MLSRYLVEQGHRVIVYEWHPNNTAMVKDILDRIEIVEGDVTDLAALMAAMKKGCVEYVIHLAASRYVRAYSPPASMFLPT